jgi:hypothetical protein
VNRAYDNILKVFTINFQSLRAKREAFWNLVDSSKPDVKLGCETWLRKLCHQTMSHIVRIDQMATEEY